MMVYVFLPAYNEEDALPKVTEKFDKAFKELNQPYRIVVLDDGSRDRTYAVATELAQKYPLQVLKHEKNEGLGPTMRDGLTAVAGMAGNEDLVVTMDCDDTHDPAYVGSALKKITEGYDVVILSRYVAGGGEEGLSWRQSILSHGAGFFLKIFFPIAGVREYSCGYRVCRASALKKAIAVFGKDYVKLPKMGFVVMPEILIKFRMLGCRIAEVPFVLHYQLKTTASKNRPLKTILGYWLLVLLYCGRKARSS